MTTGIAIIGCGLVGAKRASALPPSSRLVAVFDPNRSRAEAVGPNCDIAATATDAINAPGVDLVIVATPHRELAALACEALTAGRHVLVEKPGAVSVREAEAMERAAAARGLCARIGFNHRFHPALLEARRLVVSNEFGEIMFIRARYGHGGRRGYEREWRVNAAISGGGELIDQGIHLIDLARYLAGDLSLAFSDLRTTFWPMDVEDNAFLALQCASGALAWLHASWTEWKNLFSLEIMMERAKLEISGLGGSYGVETLIVYEMLPELGPPRQTRRVWDGADESWEREITDVLGSIRREQATGASIADAIAALRIVENAYAQHHG